MNLATSKVALLPAVSPAMQHAPMCADVVSSRKERLLHLIGPPLSNILHVQWPARPINHGDSVTQRQHRFNCNTFSCTITLGGLGEYLRPTHSLCSRHDLLPTTACDICFLTVRPAIDLALSSGSGVGLDSEAKRFIRNCGYVLTVNFQQSKFPLTRGGFFFWQPQTLYPADTLRP